MFWRFGGYANISTIDQLLEKQDVTVEELLDESDLIQELKSQNSKLVEFLRDEPVLDRLLQYVIMPKAPNPNLPVTPPEPSEVADTEGDAAAPKPTEEEPSPPAVISNPLNSLFGKRRSNSKLLSPEEEESQDEKKRLKYAYVACEVLSSDVWSIAEALLENIDSMHRFWYYLKRPSPLDGVQASYWAKVNESLLEKKTEEMLNFLRSVDHVVEDMIRHVDCPVITDLLLKIITMERAEGGAGIIDWLQGQGLIPLLLKNLSPDQEPSTQTSAGDLIKAIITISANATAQDNNVIGPNELTRQLVSEECIQTLIKNMQRGGNALTVGVGIVIEVIRKNNSDYDIENQTGPVPKSTDPIYLGTLLRQFALHIPDFMELIKNAGTSSKELKVAFGGKVESLGFDRFKTCELMAELLHCSNMILLNQRGAEAEIAARDAERARLKAEGRLSGYSEPQYDNLSLQNYGTSVNSSGFHHVRAPSFGDEAKRLEVSNSTDEEFETIDADKVDDDVKVELDEKTDYDLDEPIIYSRKQEPGTGEKSEPIESSEPQKQEDLHDDVTRQLEELVISDSSVGPDHVKKQETSPISHPEDKPAPLFFGKAKAEEPASTVASEQTEDVGDQTATPDDIPLYEVDVDGTPVVGDLLKIMFVDNHVVPTIFDFFFRFPWNNFLHNVVYDVIQQVFNGQMERGFNRCLAIDVFESARITERIIEGQVASDEMQVQKNMRLGYMGHLTLIAEEVVKFAERTPPETLSPLVLQKVTAPEWIVYVENTLADTRERDNAILGGVRPDNAKAGMMGNMNVGGLGNVSGLVGNATLGLDTVDLGGNSVGGGAVGGSLLFSGTSMMSGFGSSDEEDEELDDQVIERLSSGVDVERKASSGILDESDQANHDPNDSSGSNNNNVSMPPPLNTNPTRARRQFARRLAQRRREAEEAEATLQSPDHADISAGEGLDFKGHHRSWALNEEGAHHGGLEDGAGEGEGEEDGVDELEEVERIFMANDVTVHPDEEDEEVISRALAVEEEDQGHERGLGLGRADASPLMSRVK